MQFTQSTYTKYEIELDEQGNVTNCFQEDKNCFRKDGVEVAAYRHRSPVDFSVVQKAVGDSKLSTLKTPIGSDVISV